MTPLLRRLIALVASIAAPLLVLACLLFGLPAPAQAANIVVNDCTPAGLRAAIQAAGASGRVTFNCTIGGPTITLTQTQVVSRDVTIDGGGVITLSGGDTDRILSVPAAEKATLLNLTLAHGKSVQGGALIVTGLAVITNVTFLDNASTSSGGAIAVLSLGTADVSLSHFYTNSAVTGGAIDSAGGLSVDQSHFFGNTATRDGGAIAQASGPALVADSTFIKNESGLGGAIVTNGSLGLLRDEFDHNATPNSVVVIGHRGGGALFLGSSAQVLIRQGTFFSNTAINGGVAGVGGAILNEGGLTVRDTLFNQNHALDDGGAIFNDASLFTVTQSTFIRNSSLGEGGAISNTGGLDLETSTLVSNTSIVSGGAIANAQTAILIYTLLFNNTAPNGGAVRNHQGELDVESSTFYSNSALVGAGGAVLNNGNFQATNSTLVANDAPNASGGAVLNTGTNTPTVFFFNSTVVSNTAASGGAALRRIDGEIALVNSIVAFSFPANCQGAITKLGNDLQFGGLVGFSCGAGITETDPLLGPLQDNGGPRIGVFDVGLPTLMPVSGSPAIRAGNQPSCSPTDERGFPRFSPCDIGALERDFPVWLPLVEK